MAKTQHKKGGRPRGPCPRSPLPDLPTLSSISVLNQTTGVQTPSSENIYEDQLWWWMQNRWWEGSKQFYRLSARACTCSTLDNDLREVPQLIEGSSRWEARVFSTVNPTSALFTKVKARFVSSQNRLDTYNPEEIQNLHFQKRRQKSPYHSPINFYDSCE